jgi:putative transposase
LAGELQEEYGASMRRICATMRFNRKSMQYKLKVSPINEALRARIKEISQARVRYGYRRIHVLLKREGWTVNHKRIARLYTQEGLNLRAKGPKRRRRSAVMRVRIAPTQPNHVWCMDFMHDRLVGDARKAFRLLTVIDIFTRECLALEVIRCDQGTEFTAEALDQWAYNNRIELDFSRPGKPTDNAFAESFNASVRKELLNTSWFDTLGMARRAARSWRKDYNEVRPHRSLANKTPSAFALSAKSAS